MFSPDGEIFVAKMQLTGGASPPPGTYISIGIGQGDGSTRAFLTERQALALGRWLCRPKARNPDDRLQSPTSFPVVRIDSDPGTRPAPPQCSRVDLFDPLIQEETPASPSASGDCLVTGRFIIGLRERWSDQPTGALERELGTFEPFLARMAKRLIRGVLSGHFGPDAAKVELATDACYREVLVLLMALRGGYEDLWHNVLFGNGRGDGERDTA